MERRRILASSAAPSDHGITGNLPAHSDSGRVTDSVLGESVSKGQIIRRLLGGLLIFLVVGLTTCQSLNAVSIVPLTSSAPVATGDAD